MNNILKLSFKQLSFYLLPAFLLGGCLPEPLEVEGVPAGEPEIVVATQLIPDRTIVVWLSATFSILEASEESSPEEVLKKIAVNDAVVIISGSAGSDTLEFLGNGVYGGLSLPIKEGEVYSLKAVSETLGEISATTTVQPKVSFESAGAELTYNIYDDTLALISYKFHDPLGKNWYMLNVQKAPDREEYLQDAINPQTYTFLMDDSEFDGQVYQDRLEFYQEGIKPGDSLTISLSNISEEYYRFIELRLDNRLGLVEFLGEPLNYPTNVAGGKGYFNLHVPDIRLFLLEDQ